MAQNFWTAIFACATSATVSVGLSLVTPQKKSDAELKGLVYSLTPKVREEVVPWYQRSTTLAIFVLAIATVLTVLFW
jgi:SSS family solute:Na+ symporter